MRATSLFTVTPVWEYPGGPMIRTPLHATRPRLKAQLGKMPATPPKKNHKLPVTIYMPHMG